jgi:CheY-like chemotaxis protein
MLGKVLQSLSITYEEAEDGMQAIEKVQLSLLPEQKDLPNARRFDLILCDNIMPNMCGPAAVRSIRGMGYTGPIFGVTGTLGQDSNISEHVFNVQVHGCVRLLFSFPFYLLLSLSLILSPCVITSCRDTTYCPYFLHDRSLPT